MRHFTNVPLLNPAACSNGLITKLLVSVATGITWGEMEVNKGSSSDLGEMGGGRKRSGPGRASCHHRRTSARWGWVQARGFPVKSQSALCWKFWCERCRRLQRARCLFSLLHEMQFHTVGKMSAFRSGDELELLLLEVMSPARHQAWVGSEVLATEKVGF